MNNKRFAISDLLSPALAAVALSVFIAGCTSTAMIETDEGMSASSSMMDHSSAMMMESSSSESMTSSESMMEDSAYNDGTYSVDGVYRSPAGPEDIHVTVTLQDDIITAATVEGAATHPKSIAMQAAFIEGFGAQVVGKSIDELSLGVINGSSLTPKGFMDAVAKIKVEAAS